MSNYHCLVAGLPDIAFDGAKCQYSVGRFKEEIYPSLSTDDARVVDLILLEWDNANVLSILRHGEEALLVQTGRYSREELLAIVEAAKCGDAQEKGVPAYLPRFIEYYFAHDAQENVVWENVLSAYYYEYATSCSNSFAAGWFTFNLNVNNVLVALTARKYKMGVDSVVIGDGEIAEALRTSGARDFGLTGTLDYMEELQRLNENSRLQEREHQLDAMRWRWLDDNSVFCYFSVERLFVFLQKLIIVERWARLDAESGMERYNGMIAELKKGMDNPSSSL